MDKFKQAFANGRKARKERDKGDEQNARNLMTWQGRNISIQPTEHQKALVEAFNNGYFDCDKAVVR